jgi:hypothetical protein
MVSVKAYDVVPAGAFEIETTDANISNLRNSPTMLDKGIGAGCFKSMVGYQPY